MICPRPARAVPRSRLWAAGIWLCIANLIVIPPATTHALAAAAHSQVGDSALFSATFDSAWARIGRSYYDSTMRGLDWPAMRDTLRPQAAAAGSAAELRRVIGRMLQSLGESHFALIPSDAAQVLATDGADGDDGDVGLDVRMVEDQLLVFRIDTSGPAWEEGVRTGWQLLSIDGDSMPDLIAQLRTALGERGESFAATHGPRIAESRFFGRVGDDVAAEFSDGNGRPVQVAMTRRAARGQAVNFGYLPTVHARVEHQRLESGGSCVGVVHLSAWMPPVAAALDSAIVSHNHCAGMVFDLRGNPGGLAGMVMGVAGHFLPRPDSLGVLRLREATLHLVANPRHVDAGGRAVEPWGGRLAILVDELSASTSEIFAGAMQAIGRARVFGVRSPGYALPAQITRLPNGDLLMHVVADFTLPGGVRVEGRGVVPDAEIPLSKAALLAGRDPALDMAVEWTGSAVP
ncbi:MAG TPA: S41 family peptidase [Gemmatimonadaceae bacterium]|nr:S41 family peptidase [Gemmatimonadaceae bacterium]